MSSSTWSKPACSQRVGARFSRLAGMAGLAWGVLSLASCASPPLEKVVPPPPSLDNELELQGQVCPTPPADAVFPVKILFLVDVSGSMVVTDPANVRVDAITQVMEKYQGLPGVEFSVIAFSSAIVDLTKGFTNSPDIGTISQALSKADNLTDDQGALGAVYETLTADMLAGTAAERARSKYIIILFTDGVPDPLCSADTTPCGTTTCSPGTHCDPTTILNASNQQQESYSCDPDYEICTVPKADWGSAFSPPIDPSLYPALQAGANYNTTPQILASVTEIMALQKQYHVGSIELDTNFLFPTAALSNPLAVPFDLDRPAGEALLEAMAAAGNGSFQEFDSDTQINFLNINFSAIQVKNDVVVSFASNQSSIETGSAVVIDTDTDGLDDVQETSLGTCLAISPKCPDPEDSDGDGYTDFIEVQYRSSGFDPLDPLKPAATCGTLGVDGDGDGLRDCEETFLKTDPTNPDTDGDFLSDLTEVRNGMNPLDATDARGDINRDGILNLNEIQIGLSPSAQVTESERPFALTYQLTSSASSSPTTTGCYEFDVQHLRLTSTSTTSLLPQGVNRVYYDVYETAEDSPTNLATVRRACADVLYIQGVARLPLTGSVTFVDSDFVEISQFDPKTDCKDLTSGFELDGGAGGVIDGAHD